MKDKKLIYQCVLLVIIILLLLISLVCFKKQTDTLNNQIKNDISPVESKIVDERMNELTKAIEENKVESLGNSIQFDENGIPYYELEENWNFIDLD